MIRNIKRALQKSLGRKILSAFIAVTVVVLSITTLFAVLREEQKARTGLREQGEMLAELLSRSSLLGLYADNRKMLREAAQDVLSLDDVVAVGMYDNRYNKLYGERKGKDLSDDRLPSVFEDLHSPMVRETADAIEIVRPVLLTTAGVQNEALYFGLTDGSSERKVIGYVRVVLGKESYRRKIAAVVKQNLLIAGGSIFVSTLLIFFIIRKVIRPLVKLTDTVNTLGRGMPVEPVPVETGDEVGNLAASFNVMVRARSEAERSLRESEERYRRLVELSPDAVYVQSGGAIVFSNHAGVALLGAEKPEQVTGKPAADFMEESSRPLMNKRLAQVEEEGIAVSPLPVRYVRLDGSIVETEVAMAPFPFRGSRAALVIARDQTERRGMEEKILLYQKELFSAATEMSSLESRVEERERHLIATDLHDYVGQNLAVLNFMAGRLQKTLSSPEAVRSLQSIRETLEQTIQYTRSLTIELNPPILAELGFRPALDALVEAFRKTHHLRIAVVDDGRSGQLRGETRYLLFRCVRELLLNAAKHAEATEVRISVAAGEHALQVAIEDNGKGFTAEEMTTKDGFGLFSVRERLKRLGGTCVIESAPGQGTRVVLTAPREE